MVDAHGILELSTLVDFKASLKTQFEDHEQLRAWPKGTQKPNLVYACSVNHLALLFWSYFDEIENFVQDVKIFENHA